MEFESSLMGLCVLQSVIAQDSKSFRRFGVERKVGRRVANEITRMYTGAEVSGEPCRGRAVSSLQRKLESQHFVTGCPVSTVLTAFVVASVLPFLLRLWWPRFCRFCYDCGGLGFAVFAAFVFVVASVLMISHTFE